MKLLKEIDRLPLESTKNLELPFPTKKKLKEQENLIDSLEHTLDLPKYKKRIIKEVLGKEVSYEMKIVLKLNFSLNIEFKMKICDLNII